MCKLSITTFYDKNIVLYTLRAFIVRFGETMIFGTAAGKQMSSQHQTLFFVGSFGLTLSLLIVGSRYLVNTLNLFPADPTGSPLSFRNILHSAWGASPARYNDGHSTNTMGQTGSSDSFLIGDNLIAPIGLAVLLGFGAIVAFFVFGKTKSRSFKAYLVYSG
jgi:hypothetical protein